MHIPAQDFQVMETYQRQTGQGFGVLANRAFLFDNEEGYFELLSIFYDCLANSRSYASFLDEYDGAILRLFERNRMWKKRLAT